MKIRKYEESDCLEMIDLFYNTVHSINLKDYTPNQICAWAPPKTSIDSALWNKLFLEHETLIAEDNQMIGFGDMDHFGRLDKLYVHMNYQRMGIANKILDELEDYAQRLNLEKITTESSITALPFFEHRKFQIVKKQIVERRGEFLVNFIMKKSLKPNLFSRL